MEAKIEFGFDWPSGSTGTCFKVIFFYMSILVHAHSPGAGADKAPG